MVSTKTPETSPPYDLWIHNLISTRLLGLVTNCLDKKIRSDEPSTPQGRPSQIEAKLEQALRDLANEQVLHHQTYATLETTHTTLKTVHASLEAEFTLWVEDEVSRDTHQEANNTLNELVNNLRGELNDVRTSHTNLDTEL